MRVLLLLKIILNTRNAPKISVLKLSWFGGEPLLALTIIHDILDHTNELADKYGFVHLGSMTTNGYLLTPDLTERLVQKKVKSFQVSLDGVGEVHDKTRLAANGNGTFEKIFENLIGISNSSLDCDITLRIHLNPENVDTCETFAGQLKRYFGQLMEILYESAKPARHYYF